MKKFVVKFLRRFEVEVEAEDGGIASQIASSIVSQFPTDTCKLLSVIAADHDDSACEACSADEVDKPKPPHNGGTPNGGGSPGSPTVKVDPIVDQIAEAA